jgi:two-component system cell cycle response regulator
VKTLVVDDDPVSLRLLEATLRKWGCEALAAPNGEEALSLAKQQRPDLVIADVVMPLMDGFELCRRLKADADLKHAPVILLTALSEPTDVLDALQCGADGLRGDPIAGLDYSPKTHSQVAALLHRLSHELCSGKMIALGGGGYVPQNCADAWIAVVEALVGPVGQ